MIATLGLYDDNPGIRGTGNGERGMVRASIGIPVVKNTWAISSTTSGKARERILLENSKIQASGYYNLKLLVLSTIVYLLKNLELRT
jgi:hypothetical protein